jgi:hypothetical protein
MKLRRIYLPIFFIATGVVLCSVGLEKKGDQKKRLQDIAESYTSYPRYDAYVTKNDTDKWQWASAKCAPSAEETKNAPATGNRLYKFYIANIKAYLDSSAEAPKGQVFVKELWPVKETNKFAISSGRLPGKQAMESDKWYTPTHPGQLLVMYKTEASELNDAGWVYGVINMEKEFPAVTLYGKINSCIGCHSPGKVLAVR